MSLFIAQIRGVREGERERKKRIAEHRARKRGEAWKGKYKEEISPGVTKRTRYKPKTKSRRQ